jgi:hypothetical protein
MTGSLKLGSSLWQPLARPHSSEYWAVHVLYLYATWTQASKYILHAAEPATSCIRSYDAGEASPAACQPTQWYFG